MDTLISEATKTAEWRGHKLAAWRIDGTIADTECACGASVRVDTAPAPNGIDVGGSAVAVNHPQSEHSDPLRSMALMPDEACPAPCEACGTQLPAHLIPYWGNRTDDPRENPNYCARQSRRTPAIPWHNGQYTYRVGPMPDGTYQTVRKPCLACGKVAADVSIPDGIEAYAQGGDGEGLDPGKLKRRHDDLSPELSATTGWCTPDCTCHGTYVGPNHRYIHNERREGYPKDVGGWD